MGWQSNDCTTCFVFGMLLTSSRMPCAPSYGVPFHVVAEFGR